MKRKFRHTILVIIFILAPIQSSYAWFWNNNSHSSQSTSYDGQEYRFKDFKAMQGYDTPVETKSFWGKVGSWVGGLASKWSSAVSKAADVQMSMSNICIPSLSLAGYFSKNISSGVNDFFNEDNSSFKQFAVDLTEVVTGQQSVTEFLGYFYVRTDHNVGIEKNYDYENARTFKEGNIPLVGNKQWKGEINIRNEYHSKLPDAGLPHFARIGLNKDDKAYDFELSTPNSVSDLKKLDQINLFFHGYNVTDDNATTFHTKFITSIGQLGVKLPNALVSWTGDVGSNFITKTLYFNKAVQSANISWRGVDNAVSYLREQNPNMKINAVTHSLGARTLLMAAENGVKFDNVVLLVPAIDNKALNVDGNYPNALNNIDNLTIVSSTNQKIVFGAYSIARFGKAAGSDGPVGEVAHKSYEHIDASKMTNNKYNIEVNHHADIYEVEMVKMIIERLKQK